MISTLVQPPKTMLEVWESLPEGSLCQLINNKLIMSPAPQNIHQVVLNEVNIEISLYLRKNKIGEIRIAPFDVHFSDENILPPDILFVKNENLNKINTKGLSGAPDLVIEILSYSTSQLDFEEKKLVYERFGVQEYFVMDPGSKTVYPYYLNDKVYEAQETQDAIIISSLLNTGITF